MNRKDLLLLSPKDRKESLKQKTPSWAVERRSIFDWLQSAARQKGRLESWDSQANLVMGWVEMDQGDIEYVTLTTAKEFGSPWTATLWRGPQTEAEKKRPWDTLGLTHAYVVERLRTRSGRAGLIHAMRDIEVESSSFEDIPDWTGDLPWEDT